MKRKQFLQATGVAPFGRATVGTASADPNPEEYRPGDPRRDSPQSLGPNPFHTNGERARGIGWIERQSGRTSVRAFGRTLQLTKVGFLGSLEPLTEDPDPAGYDVDTPLDGERGRLR